MTNATVEQKCYNHVTLVGNVVSVDTWKKKNKTVKITVTLRMVHNVKIHKDDPAPVVSIMDVELPESLLRVGIRKLKSFHKPGTRILIDGYVQHLPNDMLKIVASEVTRMSIPTKKEK